jgi:hypothetical protein
LRGRAGRRREANPSSGRDSSTTFILPDSTVAK